jgi:regulator of nonsense transcripts 1
MGKPFAPASSSKSGHSHSGSAAPSKPGVDEVSVADPDEMLLYHSSRGRPGRRRDDDDDNQTELYDGEDKDSLASAAVDDVNGIQLQGSADEDISLPEHACE